MFWWSIQITGMSLLIIFLVHHLVNFFKSNLTVPKVKDLVNAPAEQYRDIYNILHSTGFREEDHATPIDLLPTNASPAPFRLKDADMKNELKAFLKSQLNDH